MIDDPRVRARSPKQIQFSSYSVLRTKDEGGIAFIVVAKDGEVCDDKCRFHVPIQTNGLVFPEQERGTISRKRDKGTNNLTLAAALVYRNKYTPANRSLNTFDPNSVELYLRLWENLGNLQDEDIPAELKRARTLCCLFLVLCGVKVFQHATSL